MGQFKDLMMEHEERQNQTKIAELLGLTIDELDELDYTIETDESKDGMLYSYRIEFDTDHSNHSMLKKVKNLEDNCRVYLMPYELDEDYYYEEEFDAILNQEDHHAKFNRELSNLKSLLTIKLDMNLESILNRQIFISVISTMETFLFEVFISTTINETEYLKKFISTHPAFKQSKFELRDIFTEYDRIEETAKKIMLDTIYHNLPSVSNMYKDTFGITFPPINEVYKYVMLRHDLVHRNGKDKDGNPVPISDKDIIEMMDKISAFIFEIAKSLGIDEF